jgi:hypothetical protein
MWRFFTLLFLLPVLVSAQQGDSVLVDENGMVIEVIEAAKPKILPPEYGTGVAYLLEHPKLPVDGYMPGMTQVMVAARKGDQKEIVRLLESGQSVAEHDLAGKSALHHAVEANKHDVIFLLILQGADVFETDVSGETVLHKAARNGMAQSIHLFLQFGLNPEARDKSGVTPLMLSTAHDKFDCALLLLKTGINPNTEDNHGNSALHAWVAGMISRKGAVTNVVVKKGKKKAKGKAKDADPDDALPPAEMESTKKWKQLFKKYRFDTFSKNADGFTPVEFARNAGREDISDIVASLAK